MATVLYLDCSSGASGDMLLGALIDLGLSLADLQHALGGMLPDGCELQTARVTRGGIAATRFTLVEPAPALAGSGAGAHRHLPAILRLIEASSLPAAAKLRATACFERLARVEADIHQMPIDRIHFHEVGALDSIVDIAGVAWAFDRLGVGQVVASPLNVGSGTVDTAHGTLPVPAPATLRLLEGIPVYSTGTPMEMVTPTGALLVSAYASSFGSMPAMIPRRIGYGAGSREIEGRPNVMRAVLGDAGAGAGADHGRVAVLHCNIDDMNPQVFGVLIDKLYQSGALEVFYTPVHMKKNRPGTLVTVIAAPSQLQTMVDVLFRETTTIGVRHQEMDRECLARERVTVSTPYGPVRIKVARREQRVMNASPEFDDCVRQSTERDAPVKDVYNAAIKAYLDSSSHFEQEPPLGTRVK